MFRFIVKMSAYPKDVGDRLFVYGTLLAASTHPIRAEMLRGARYQDRAMFRGSLYWMGLFPGAVDSDEGYVHGEVYQVIKPTLWEILDAFEGCEDGLFRRERRPVELAQQPGKRVEAWLYLFNQSVAGLTRIESGDCTPFLKMSRSSLDP